MPPNSDLVPCPKCGQGIPFKWSEFKRNANLVFTCAACGLNDLAMNVVTAALYERAKELGHTNLKPPTPKPIDPITVVSSEDGYEVVIQRYKNGRERLFRRKVKSTPPT